MKNLKDIIIGIFAGIGVMTLLMGNNPQSEQMCQSQMIVCINQCR